MLLNITDLTKQFVRRGRTFAAVDHVHLSIDAGEFVAIVGRSGNGKSTLLNMIAGLLKPTEGTVSIDGQNVAELSDRDLAMMRNQTLGFVTQGHTLLGNLTVLDNVILPATMFPSITDNNPAVSTNGHEGVSSSESDKDARLSKAVEQSEASVDPDMPDVISPLTISNTISDSTHVEDALETRAHELLVRLGVDDLAQSYPKELSGGEIRRVSIARALMNHPKLLIADEPTGDLDAESTDIVMRLLRSVADEGTAVLMVTHDVDALPFADRVLRMDAGKLQDASQS